MALANDPDELARARLLRASRRSEVASFIVMDVMRAAAAKEAAGERVIHMEVGQPATPAPRLAREALSRAMERETLGYTLALGITPLRERIARHYRERYGVDVDPERIVVTTGSSAAFVLAFLALFDAGARVGAAEPGLSLLPAHPDEPRLPPGRDRDGSADAMDAGAGPGRGARQTASTGCSSPAPPIRPARC